MTLDEQKTLWNEAVKLRLVGKINAAGDVKELAAVSLIAQELSAATAWPVTPDLWQAVFKRYSTAHKRHRASLDKRRAAVDLPNGVKPIKYRPAAQWA